MAYQDVKLINGNLYFEDKDGTWKHFVVRGAGGGGRKSSGTPFAPAFGYAYFNQSLDYNILLDPGDVSNSALSFNTLINNLNITQSPASGLFRTLIFKNKGKYRIDYSVGSIRATYVYVPEPPFEAPPIVPLPSQVALFVNDVLMPETQHLKNPITYFVGEGETTIYQDVLGSFIVDIPANASVELRVMASTPSLQIYEISGEEDYPNIKTTLTINKVD